MSRLGPTGKGFTRVAPTRDEQDDWRRKNPSRPNGPNAYRVRCDACGKRYWGSGIAVGAHRRACPGPAPTEGTP